MTDQGGGNPNVLLVFSDQHRWCDLGCYGNRQVISPNLDRFSTQAAVLKGCISNEPVCVPARGSLLTGLLPLRHGAVANDLPIRADVESIAHVLDRNGYHTGYVGKWHLQGIPRDAVVPPERRLGFREWKVCNCSHAYLDAYYYDESDSRIGIDGYEPIAQTDLAIDFIRRNRGKPWGLVLSWGPPHDPYDQVPEEYLRLYAGADVLLRPNVPDVIAGPNRETHGRQWAFDSYRGYYAHITALDHQFGRLIEALERTGQLDNTVVVYMSDHGDMLGSQGQTNKQWPYEESIRVPLMVYWKGRTARITHDEMIGVVDVPVSLLGLVGLELDGPVDGQDLHALFVDGRAKGLDECYIHSYIPCHQAALRETLEWRAIRTRQFTFARTSSDDGYELFDNIRDPYQMKNLIRSPAHAVTRGELGASLEAHVARHDKLLPWEELIRVYGLRDEWNRSQRYFGLPLLD